MESPERKVIYRQGFRSSKLVTGILNSFVKTPQRSFTFFSNAEYVHQPLETMKYDDQDNRSVADRIREINDRVSRLDTYSKNLATRTIHLSLPAGGTEDKRGLLLRFSPLAQEAGTYWKVIKELYDPESPPSPAEIVRLTQQDIYVGLPAKELRSKISLHLAKQTLAHALRDPDQKYDLGITNIVGLSRSDFDLPVVPDPQEISHPDIINEDVV
jgi:hypothetical protein